MSKINFSETDIDHIVKLRTVDGMGMKEIGQVFGVSLRPIKKALESRGIFTGNLRYIEFDEATKKKILEAYESGIGAKGIPSFLGLHCTERPVIRFLESVYETLRNRSEQQYARMAKMTPEEVAKFTENAHKAARGRKATREERIKRAKTLEGRHCPQSKWEPIVFNLISKDFPNAIPSKAFDIYNFDIGIGNSIAVEIFGGGWACTDKRRINHYLERTKEIGKFGIHTIFVVIDNCCDIGNADELIRTINFASRLPAETGQYWVVWGNRQGASGSSFNINKDAFIRPFVNIRDWRTGRYASIPR